MEHADTTTSLCVEDPPLETAVRPLGTVGAVSITVRISWAGDSSSPSKYSYLEAADKHFRSQSDYGTCNQTAINQTSTGVASSKASSITAVPSSTQSAVSSATSAAAVPSPTQANSIAMNCNRYSIAESGDYCWIFAQKHSITVEQLYAWNTVLGVGGSNCGTAFWLGYYYCTGVSA